MTRPSQTTEELAIFNKFAKHYPIGLTGIETRNAPEPDIRCKGSDSVAIAFEVVELIDQEFARKLSAMSTLQDEFDQSFISLPSEINTSKRSSTNMPFCAAQ